MAMVGTCKLTLLATGLCYVGLGCPAWAADAQSSTPQDHSNTDAASEAPAAPAPAQQLGAITVTGELLSPYNTLDSSTVLGTDTPIQDTPFSITAIPDKVLEDQDAQSLADAVRNAPGVATSWGEGNRDELVMRGVKTKSDFFMDGMRDDSEYYRPLYNVKRIDVLKGPAALELGRAGAGGIVNYVTKKAERREIRHVEFEGGSWWHGKGSFDYGTPIGDNGAFRLMGMLENSDSYRDHTWVHRFAINPKFHFDLSDKTDIDFSISYLNDRRFADRGIPSENGRPVDVKRSQIFGSVDQNRAHTQVTAGDFRIHHQVNDHLQLRNHFRVSYNNRDYINVYPHKAVGYYAPGKVDFKAYDHPSKRWTIQDRLEAIWDVDTGPVSHTVLTGLEYTWQRDHDTEYRPSGAYAQSLGDKTVSHTVLNGAYLADLGHTEVPPVVEMDYLDRDNVVRANEIGAFVQDEVTFGKHWKALGGVRLDYFDMNGHWTGDNGATSAHKSRSDTKLSPRFALMYNPVENDTLYASFSRSYTPTGANLALSLKGPDGANLSPERADSYEIGNKLSLFDDNLLLGVALYQLNLKNRNVKLTSGRIVATGKMRNRGIEVYANGNITDQWRVFANYAYTDSEFTTPVEKGKYQGNRPGLVPRNQFSVWTTYALDKHWGIGAGIHGASAKYASYENEVTLPGYAVGDVMAYYQEDKFRFQLNVDNVTNKKYYSTATGANQILPGSPTRVIAKVSVDF